MCEIEATKVVNKRTEDYDVYVGRGSPFGNPFKIGEHGSRAKVIELYRVYFYDKISVDPEFRHLVTTLKGKRLGCFCKPQACHADVIFEYLESPLPGDTGTNEEQLSLF